MRPGVITGRVFDEYGEPFVNARVEAHQFGWLNGKRTMRGSDGATTNDLGEFRIHNLAPGAYAVSAADQVGTSGNFQVQPALDDPEGARLQMSYARTYYPNALDWSNALLVDVSSGTEVQGIRIDMKPQRTLWVSGQVTGVPKSVLPFVSLQLRRVDSQGRYGGLDRVCWDQNGELKFQGLSPGRYLLQADIQQSPEMNRIGWRQFEITDRPLDRIELRLMEGIAVPGAIVLDTDLEDLSLRVHVSLTPKEISDAQLGASANPDTGTFTLQGVPAWTYQVYAGGHHPSGNVPPFYLSEVRVRGVPLPETELTIGDTPPQDLELVLAQSARVSGVVVDENKAREPN